MTNEELVMKIKAGEDPEKNMEQLYLQVKAFIHTIAWAYRDSGELEDLEQEGFIALYPAINGYDPAAGCKFLTYAENWIRQGMQQYIQFNGSCMRLSVGCANMVRKWRRFCSAFQRENGREPSEADTAYYMGLTLEQVQNIRRNSCVLNLASLDSPVTGTDGGEDATVGDFVPAAGDLEEEVTDRLQEQQLKDVLWGFVDELEGNQPEVIRSRYLGNQSYSQIADSTGRTPEQVRQIHAKALRRLRAHDRQLRPFLPEEQIYSMAIHGGGIDQFKHSWTSSTERVAVLSADWEERRRQRIDMLERVRQQVANQEAARA